MLDTTRLVTLHAVLTHGSFTAAAAALHLTQPAVSRQVSLLERQLGTLLVHRTQQGVRPTEAGRLLFAHAETLLAGLERAEREVRDLAGLTRGTVRLGSFLSALVHLSAELAAALGERHPGLVVVDELVDRAAALARLRRGGLDLALVCEPDLEPAPPADDVELHALFDDPLRVALPAGHRLAGAAAVRVRDLAADTWIRPHDGSAARRLDAVLTRAGVTPPLLLAGHGDEPVETQALVAAGRGVALTHDLTVVVGGHDLVLRPLADEPGSRRVQAAVLPGPRPPATAAALAALQRIGTARRARLSSR
ncbi:LysR family transcriptional regulator [Geodermatophilus sp. SYSU D00698]